MSERKPDRRVLLIGAHLDGQWANVQAGAYTYRVPKPVDFSFPADPKLTDLSMPEIVDYRLERLPIAIRSVRAELWVGVASGLFGPERDRAIVRALFQRDVAQLFREDVL